MTRATESRPSGVRLAFRSAATVIALDPIRSRTVPTGLPERPDGTVDLLVDGVLTQQVHTHGSDEVRADPAPDRVTVEPGTATTLTFDGLPGIDEGIKIWLPHYERTELVALRTDAPIDRSVPMSESDGYTAGVRSAKDPMPQAQTPPSPPSLRRVPGLRWSTWASQDRRCWTRSPRGRSEISRPTSSASRLTST